MRSSSIFEVRTGSELARRALAKCMAILMVVAIIYPTRAIAAPADIFQQAAPALGSDPPKAADVKDGDVSVATATGALTYQYPVQLPPGRLGMSPKVALNYSSQAPAYGGVAAGWTLAAYGMIQEDTSRGRLRTHSPAIEAQQADPRADDLFVVDGSQLTAVPDFKASDVYMTYRVRRGDASYARYERLNASPSGPRWRMLATDGSTMLFGDPAFSPTCASMFADGYAPVTSTTDVFGNQVRYEYEQVIVGECRLKKISWGHNVNPAAGLPLPFAEVVFTWERGHECSGALNVHTGSQISYRTGTKVVTGASKLMAITATAYPPGAPASPEHTRLITLGYSSDDTNCGAQHAPVRLLTSIQESAWGIDMPRVDLPAVTFEYGDPTVNLATASGSATPWSAGDSQPATLAWGYRREPGDDRWPTVEAMMMDIDGDGLLDRVVNASTPGTNGQCVARWQRNLGPGASATNLPQFGGLQTIALPKLKWRGGLATYPTGGSDSAAISEDGEFREGCALNGQVTAFVNSTETFNACHNQSQCANGSDPSNPGPFCYPGGTDCPPGEGTEPDGTFRTYLAYRWLDADSDGLVDLVAAVHGDIDRYDIGQGNMTAFLGTPEPELFGPWPACPGVVETCKEISGACVDAARSCPPGQPCTVDQTAMNACVATAATKQCHELIKNIPPAQSPGGGGTPAIPTLRAPYMRCEGLYPWFIYKNQGNGVFSSSPIIKYQPVPLESDVGDSNLTGTSVASQNHAILDFDGDGVLDAVAHPRGLAPAGGDYTWWFVWLGDGTGGFGPTRHVFGTREDPFNAISSTAIEFTGPNGKVSSSQGLLDVNGDGLPEHWLRKDPAGNANVAFHVGTNFDLVGAPVATDPAIGRLDTPINSSPVYGVKPGNDATAVVTLPTPWFPGDDILGGETTTLNRTTDVDNDGRVDVVRWGASPAVHFNLGGQFTSAGVSYPGDSGGLQRKTVGVPSDPLIWQLSGDLIDLDGDGISEAVHYNGFAFDRKVHVSTAPPRLLRKVHNGRGAHIIATYTSMHDTSTVEQHPELAWAFGRPKANPRAQWVVKNIETIDDFALTDSVTSYFYRNPRNNADDDGLFGFRGFEEVITTAPSGARTIQRYSFSPDFSGRLAETLVQPFEYPTEVRSISRTTWEERLLFGGLVKTYHATLSESLTCKNGQTETGSNACTPTTAAAYTRTSSTLVGLPSTTQSGAAGDGAWVASKSLLQPGTANAEGDRQTLSTFAYTSSATTYRLRALTSTRQHRVGGTMTTFAKSATTWDATLTVPLTAEVWFDSDDNHRAISRRVYDMSTGNVIERWKPVQNAAGTTRTTYSYDSRELFVQTETNELGHPFAYTYEYGTGSKILTEGPNFRACTTNCPSGPQYPIREQRKVRVDGLGRPIEHWETLSDDGIVYTLTQLSRTSYVDAVTATVPCSATTETALNTSFSSFKREKSEVDGVGRPLRSTLFAQGSAPSDHVTSYKYRNDGTLDFVTVPDPTANNASVVTYRYTFDSLGRAVAIRRPDAIAASDQSGADIVYDGVTRTVSNFVGAAGGLSAATKTISDSFGRLIEVHERTATIPETWAITRYTYGPDDIVSRVVDPEAVTTDLVHDFAGHRTQIIRYGRVWKYSYDLNGNVIAEQVPGSTSPVTDPDFTTSIAYDALDRQASKMIAKRTLSDSDRALFVSGTETFTWDLGANHIGYLRYWNAFAPNASTPAMRLELFNDNSGRRTITEQRLTIAGYPEIGRSFRQSFRPFGGVSTSYYNDAVAQGGATSNSQVTYDARGLPLSVRLIRGGVASDGDITIATLTRNVAGLVTKRRANTTGPMTFIESNWTYDKLGRVTSQVVQKGPGPSQIVRQDLAYLGNDNPQTLDHYLGDVRRQFQYTYDLRHQITATLETTTPGYFSGTYQYGSAGRFTNATELQAPAPPGSNVVPRDVSYQYANPDPEQVTSLTHVSGALTGLPFATYTYDAAGNQVTRCYGPTTPTCAGESMDFLYDGKDQLRRATRKLNGIVQASEEYWYDSGGARTAIVKRDGAGNKTELTRFIGEVESHYDGTGAVTEIRSHVSLGTPLGRISRTSDSNAPLEFQHHGLASSTIAAVAFDGTVNASMSYSPFGEIVEALGPELSGQTRRMNDKYVDDLAALTYYGARYYDRIAIQWTQADPVYVSAPDARSARPRSGNIYEFSLNNAVRYIDTDGLDSRPSLSFYRSEMEAVNAGRALNEISGSWGVTTNSCIRNSNRCSFILNQDNSAAIAKATSERMRVYFAHAEFKGDRGWESGWPDDIPSHRRPPMLDGTEKSRDESMAYALGGVTGTAAVLGAVGLFYLSAAIGEGIAAAAASEAAGGTALAGRALGTAGSVASAASRAPCFAAGTPVLTPYGLVAIEQIGVGDLVWSRDENSGKVQEQRVVRLFVTPDQPIHSVVLVGRSGIREVVRVTSEHPFWVMQIGWIPARDLKLGQTVALFNDGWAEVADNRATDGVETVYNFEVENTHTYFVGILGAWVHNNCWENIARHSIERGHVVLRSGQDLGARIQSLAAYVQRLSENAVGTTTASGAQIWRQGNEILIKRGDEGTYFFADSARAAQQYVSRFIIDEGGFGAP